MFSEPFSLLGVSLSFLLHFVDIQCEGREKLMGFTTAEVKDRFVLDLTSASQLSLCEQMQNEGQLDYVGKASWFISHAWQCQFLQVVDAILSFFRTEVSKGKISENEMLSTIIWFDLFSNSQHNTTDKPFEWWQGTFTNAIKEMGNVLQVLTPWDDPIPFTRAWCVFEIYACVTSNSRYHIAMTDIESRRFLSMILERSGQYHKMLACVDTSKSVSFLAEDQVRIHDAIRRLLPGSFTQLNSMVLRVAETWMLSVLEDQLESARAAGDDVSKEVGWMNALGTLYFSQGKYAEAELLFVECLEKKRIVFGSTHADTLTSLHGLAALYNSQGKYAEAEPLYIDCLEKRRIILGDNHRSTLASLNGLATLYINQGRFADAEPLYIDCLEKRRFALGETHSDTLTSLNNLAGVYRNQKRYTEAEPLYVDCLEKKRILFGNSHPSTLDSLSNLALLHHCQGSYTEAETLCLECLDKRKQVLGDMHPDTFISLNNLARLYVSQGKYNEAELLYIDCLEKKKRVLGGTHPSTLLSLSNLAALYESQSKQADADADDGGNANDCGNADDGRK